MSKIAVIRGGKIIYLDKESQVLKPNETSARERRQRMKTDRRKELLQKNDLNYYRAYPEQAKNLSPEIKRLI